MDNSGIELFKIMLNRYRSGTATREEITFLESWFDLADSADDFIKSENEAAFEQLKVALKEKIDVEIRHVDMPRQAPKRMPIRRWAAAAAVVAIMGATALLLVSKTFRQTAQQPPTAHATGVPTLRLADGTLITLDSTASGKIAHQNGVIISKEKDGTLLYTAASSTETGNASQENVLSTPAGMKFRIILPDGSTVWLNAASTLKYPASFGNTNRVVKLEGEAYFDVATAGAARPFIVQSGSQSVQVLGTIFNVNAYPEDGLSKTTLIQGSVKVMNNRESIVIRPGQQAGCDLDNNSLRVINTDTEKETAWINNMFSFKNDSLQSVLRDVAHWYNVAIKYSGRVPDERFSGEISRSSKLKDVLKILEINGITFEIKENIITVVNKN